MNKFQDNDHSYDDLLNEYAGDSLPSKPIKEKSEFETKKAPSQPVRNENKPVPTNDKPSYNPYSDESSFDIDLLKKFEEPERKKPVTNVPEESPRGKGKFVVNIDYAKTFAIGVANKVKTAAANARTNQAEPNDELNNDESFENTEKTKKKFDMIEFLGFIVRTFEENRKQFIAFGCCILVSFVLAGIAISCINDVLAINRDGEETIEVVLPDNADTAEAIKVLDKAGLVKNSIFCNIFAKFMGFSDENYLSGIYYFTDDMGVEKMLTRFKTSSTRGTVISITIPEGYTVDQIFQRLEKNNICTAESLYRVLNTVDFGNEYDFIAKLQDTDERYCVLEGYLFPATYEFEQGAEPATVIRKFLDAFKNRWTEEYAAKATELGMSVDEIITLASIIEKEGKDKDQFVNISSVLHNRLNRSGIFATLECNSTNDYVENTVSKRASPNELKKYVVSYNSYQSEGLPPSAICNPGTEAIDAALFPKNTKYYFFRHDKNGKIYLAETLEEHSANGRVVNKVNAEK
ncbi:MAG: endolytic transglycosylase MltG [Clostridia bacterium]|nr:endolytic transglycosylase MltG [Clostridia bacterium]